MARKRAFAEKARKAEIVANLRNYSVSTATIPDISGKPLLLLDSLLPCAIVAGNRIRTPGRQK